MYKKIFFFLYGDSRINLYLSLASIFKEQGHSITFIVDSKKSYNIIHKDKKYSIISNKFTTSISGRKYLSDDDIKMIIDDTIDIKTKKFTINQAIISFRKTLSILENIDIADSLVFAGPGCHIEDLAICYFKNKTNKSFHILFSEICNINGKTFFDPIGANYSSLFYKLNDEFISSINEDNYISKYSEFIDYIVKIKMSTGYKPKQAFKKSISDNFKEIIQDLIYGFRSALLLKTLSFSLQKYMYYLKNYYSSYRKNKKTHQNYSSDIDSEYLFLPLQVSTDTQLIYNSNYDNLSSIKHFLGRAKDENLRLVVKLHPAEKSISEINKILSYCNNNSILASEKNTYELIKKASLVGINNSTVGLESIFLGKRVEFIGNTFYKKFTKKKWLYFYLFDYLIDIDYFDPDIKDRNNLYTKIINHAHLYNTYVNEINISHKNLEKINF